MRVIGVTGGVGAGKSNILGYINGNYNVRLLMADSIGHELMEKGHKCYFKIGAEFGDSIFDNEMNIDRKKLGEVIFASPDKREKINSIIHPAVKEYIINAVREERELKNKDYVIIEAALLIEGHLEKICDEMWYIYASEDTRRKRLKSSRAYSKEKIDSIMSSQLSDTEFRKKCNVVIDNDASQEVAFAQIDDVMKNGPAVEKYSDNNNENQLIFGLDIGTRNLVGTVGYKENEQFHVVAQCIKQHETRAMVDGQIHDITKVGRTVDEIKKILEEQIGEILHDVCIAAAGRVLKTVTTKVDYEFEEETVVTGEHIHSLDLLGIEKAQGELNDINDTKFKFYCVGYTIVKYYLNDDIISNLESHKADKISEEIIVTFLPEDVVDGLYAAVGLAGLEVLNLTLEPIAAINVAIPETYRMLNIALIDVGAGTSDISVTKDGSIIAYGMIPHAGDEITEIIVQKYLVDFKTAENIKIASGQKDTIQYKDIMCIPHQIEPEEVWELTQEVVDKIAGEVSDKIRELNAGQTVSAVFIVGGGGKIHGFPEKIAQNLELPEERVALRGEEVLQEIDFRQNGIAKDPLIVTPIGICLNYYEQKNSFIFVHFNGERIKIYNNNRLTIVDAALEAGFPNEYLFPRSGKELNFTINGKPRIVRGGLGESAVIKIDGREVNMNTPIENNNNIEIKKSTEGEAASYTIGQLAEYSATLTFNVNGQDILCPRFAEVRGELESEYYSIADGDNIIMRNYYTVQQLIDFMDVSIDFGALIFVNNKTADLHEKVYENFTVELPLINYVSTQKGLDEHEKQEKEKNLSDLSDKDIMDEISNNKSDLHIQTDSEHLKSDETDDEPLEKSESSWINVMINGSKIEITGKKEPIFVDIFDFISFDLSKPRGNGIITLINKQNCGYNDPIRDGDVIEIYWDE